MIPLPVLILVGVVLSILIGFGSYQFYFKDWKSCDWGYGCPTPSAPTGASNTTCTHQCCLHRHGGDTTETQQTSVKDGSAQD